VFSRTTGLTFFEDGGEITAGGEKKKTKQDPQPTEKEVTEPLYRSSSCRSQGDIHFPRLTKSGMHLGL
jgi:hypothetical protein